MVHCDCDVCQKMKPNKKTRMLCPTRQRLLIGDLNLQDKLKQKMAKVSVAALSEKYGITASSIEYMRRTYVRFKQ